MMQRTEFHDFDGTILYPAGFWAAPGRYREIETGREVFLEYEGRLPASLDGRVAHYRPIDGDGKPQRSSEPFATEWSLPPSSEA